MSRPLRFRLAAAVLAAGALGACSPTFNWREVPIADQGLIALLPCKPDHATRRLPLGSDASVEVDMTGCQAGGATFAVAHAVAADAAQADTWMRAWRAAIRTQLTEAEVTENASALPRAAQAPAPSRLEAARRADAGGAPSMPTRVLWFAQQSPRGGAMALYQATVIGEPDSSEALSTFFEGLRLP